MRKLANLFLIIFLVSAGAEIVNALLHIFLHIEIFSGFSLVIWLTCLFFSSLVYLGFGFNKHLPKVILIPLFLWLFWRLLQYWPLEATTGEYSHLYLSCGQLLLGFAALKLNRAINQQHPLLVRSQFAGPAFSGRNLLIFCLLSLPILPMAFILTGYSFVDKLVETNTAGFVQLKPNGLYMTERVYRQGDKSIRLAGMIHLGKKDFYSDMTSSLSHSRTLILAEGVTDESQLLTQQFDYRKIADLLDLTSQENIPFRGRLIESIEADNEEGQEPNIPDILRADIDIQQFNPHTREVLNALAKYVLNSESLTHGYREFNLWSQEHITPESNDIIMNDLIHKRNQSVLNFLPAALHKYDTIIIPWGALHMKGIEKAVQEKGFDLEESHERLSIDFLLLPYEKLWKNLTGRVQ